MKIKDLNRQLLNLRKVKFLFISIRRFRTFNRSINMNWWHNLFFVSDFMAGLSITEWRSCRKLASTKWNRFDWFFNEKFHRFEFCLEVRSIAKRLFSAHATRTPIVVLEVQWVFYLNVKFHLLCKERFKDWSEKGFRPL